MTKTLRSSDFDGEAEVQKLFDQTSPDVPPVDVGLLPKLVPTRATALSKLRPARIAMAMGGLASCAALIVAVVWVSLRPAVSFADVKESVFATNTIQYDESRFVDDRDEASVHAEHFVIELKSQLANIDKKMQAATEDEKVQLRTEQEEMQEMLDNAENRIQQHANKSWRKRVMILGRHQQRTETESVHGDRVTIVDMKVGKTISIDHANRSAVRYTRQVEIDEDTGETTEYRIEPNPNWNFYDQLKSIPVTAVNTVDSKTIDGKELIGFQATEVFGKDTWTRTYWVDAKTNLPRQIDVRYRSTDKRHGAADWRLANIEFDASLDKSLFSTEPPTGYSVEESKILAIVPAN